MMLTHSEVLNPVIKKYSPYYQGSTLYLCTTSSSDICDVKLSYNIFKKAKKTSEVDKPLKRAAMECSFYYFLRTYYICMLNCVLCSSSLNTFPTASAYCPRTLLSNLSQRNAYFFNNSGVRNIS